MVRLGQRKAWFYGEQIARSLLLMGVFLIPLWIMRGKSASYDEVTHLPAGYSYLTTGVVKLNPQHPPLIKEICAIPLLFLNPSRLVDRKKLESDPLEPNFEWEYGRKFLFDQDADRLLFWGRVPAVLLSLGLGVLVMSWAKELWGRSASLLALFLYAFDPTITAHAQFVTTDLGFSFFATLFLFIFRKYLLHPSSKWLVFSGISLGLALGSKFSGLILIPIAVLLLFGRRRHPHSRHSDEIGTGQEADVKRWGACKDEKPSFNALITIILILITATLIVWAIYVFPADPFIYLKGLKAVNRDHHPDYPYYLMGKLKPGGWRSYFLVAGLIKVPIPALLLLLLSIGLFWKGERTYWLDEAFLFIPTLAFFVGYSLKADNIGIRYIIPCFPFLIISTVRSTSWLLAKPSLRIVLFLVLGWYLIEFVTIFPDHLSYFNQIAGGYERGPEWLDDSNVDWGQGLIQLREYLKSRKLSDYLLVYFGSGDPQYYGIPNRNVTGEVSLSPPHGRTVILSGHYLARLRALAPREESAGGQSWWTSKIVAKDIVGHAYYVYEF